MGPGYALDTGSLLLRGPPGRSAERADGRTVEPQRGTSGGWRWRIRRSAGTGAWLVAGAGPGTVRRRLVVADSEIRRHGGVVGGRPSLEDPPAKACVGMGGRRWTRYLHAIAPRCDGRVVHPPSSLPFATRSPVCSPRPFRLRAGGGAGDHGRHGRPTESAGRPGGGAGTGEPSVRRSLWRRLFGG